MKHKTAMLVLVVACGAMARLSADDVAAQFKTAQDDYKAQMDALKAQFDPQFATAKSDYLAKLVELEQKLSNARRTEDVQRVKEEQARVQEGRAAPATSATRPVELLQVKVQYAQKLSDFQRQIAPKQERARTAYTQKLDALLRMSNTSNDAAMAATIRSEKTIFSIQQVVAAGKYIKTEMVGGINGSLSEDTAQYGGLLIGFNLFEGDHAGHKIVKALEPVYATATGEEVTRRYGLAGGTAKDVIAKKGYAVGEITAKGSDRLDGIQIIFMRIKDDGITLDRMNSYTSEWFGGAGLGNVKKISGSGKAPIGILVRSGDDIDALGLLYLQ